MPDPVNRGLPMSMEGAGPSGDYRGAWHLRDRRLKSASFGSCWFQHTTSYLLAPQFHLKRQGFPSPLTTVSGPQLGLSASTSPAFCLPSMGTILPA